MTPKSTTQNLLLWGIALLVAVFLSFLSGVATHWPENGQIDYRAVWLGVIQTLLTTVPIVAAGLGLPRLGREDIGHLTSAVGHDNARAALEVEAMRQTGDVTTAVDLSSQQLDDLAERLLVLRDAHDRAEQEARP